MLLSIQPVHKRGFRYYNETTTAAIREEKFNCSLVVFKSRLIHTRYEFLTNEPKEIWTRRASLFERNGDKFIASIMSYC